MKHAVYNFSVTIGVSNVNPSEMEQKMCLALLIIFCIFLIIAPGEMSTSRKLMRRNNIPQWKSYLEKNFDSLEENEEILAYTSETSNDVIPKDNGREKLKVKVNNEFKPREKCYPDMFCTNSTFYPREAIKQLLKEKKNRRKFSHLSGSVIQPSDHFSPKARDSLVYTNFCQTRAITKMPDIALDAKMNPKYIVNTEEYRQTVTYKTCTTSDYLDYVYSTPNSEYFTSMIAIFR
ncbi:hypothetical protein JTB14_029976 [Gonioctena quinquepunctata]|nr:hypothetical protein JTB14_029976 [Gonioctena quinquepunctata]